MYWFAAEQVICAKIWYLSPHNIFEYPHKIIYFARFEYNDGRQLSGFSSTLTRYFKSPNTSNAPPPPQNCLYSLLYLINIYQLSLTSSPQLEFWYTWVGGMHLWLYHLNDTVLAHRVGGWYILQDFHLCFLVSPPKIVLKNQCTVWTPKETLKREFQV